MNNETTIKLNQVLQTKYAHLEISILELLEAKNLKRIDFE